MKFSLLILSLFILGTSNAYSQHFNIEDLKKIFFDLPLGSNKTSIINAARKKLNYNILDSISIESNAKIYFLDTTAPYSYILNKPTSSMLKICELWSANNSKNSDTAFYVIISASYGTDDKAQKKMFSEYNSLKKLFDRNFTAQKPYTLYAEGQIAEGINFFLKKDDKIPSFNIGWNNGGCFRNYQISISYKQ